MFSRQVWQIRCSHNNTLKGKDAGFREIASYHVVVCFSEKHLGESSRNVCVALMAAFFNGIPLDAPLFSDSPHPASLASPSLLLQDAMGMLIGKGGSGLREMQEKTGVKVRF